MINIDVVVMRATTDVILLRRCTYIQTKWGYLDAKVGGMNHVIRQCYYGVDEMWIEFEFSPS